jgi:hypothetical protein
MWIRGAEFATHKIFPERCAMRARSATVRFLNLQAHE